MDWILDVHIYLQQEQHAWGLGKDVGWQWCWKQFLAKWLACPQTKQKTSFPRFVSLGLLLLLKALFLFLEKKRLSPKLILVKPMLLERLRERLTRALNKIGLRMRIGFLQMFFRRTMFIRNAETNKQIIKGETFMFMF